MRKLLGAVLGEFTDRRPVLSLGAGLTNATAHGVIHHVGTSTGWLTQHQCFLVDRPMLLRHPTTGVLKDLFDQARVLGLAPTHIELHVGKRHVYNQRLELVFSQSL